MGQQSRHSSREKKAVFTCLSYKCSEIKTMNAVMAQESQGDIKKEAPWDACDKTN